MPATTDYRNEMINGLVDLAAFLEANPDMPVSYSGVSLLYFPKNDTDAEKFAEVDRIAAQLGTDVEPSTNPTDHYRTALSFGPVTYEAIVIPATARARHHAEASYHGCIQPDTV